MAGVAGNVREVSGVLVPLLRGGRIVVVPAVIYVDGGAFRDILVELQVRLGLRMPVCARRA